MEKPTFLVECIFDQVYLDNDEPKQYRSKISSQIWSFEDDDPMVALQSATEFFEEIKRDGLTLQGGSVLKSVIPPSHIRQVGLIDLRLEED